MNRGIVPIYHTAWKPGFLKNLSVGLYFFCFLQNYCLDIFDLDNLKNKVLGAGQEGGGGN